MDPRMWSSRVLIKYSLIQLAAATGFILILILVRQWICIPLWLLWCLIGLWVAKDVILYPFVWRAYEWNPSGQGDPMIGLKGIAEERIDPSGYIIIKGELWQARLIDKGDTIEKGEPVRVKAREGLVLHIEHDPESPSMTRP